MDGWPMSGYMGREMDGCVTGWVDNLAVWMIKCLDLREGRWREEQC